MLAPANSIITPAQPSKLVEAEAIIQRDFGEEMGRSPCCPVEGIHKGTWSAYEDNILINYIRTHGEGKWTHVPRRAGLKRCGKSCRMRWLNYLRPDIKRGNISEDEEDLIIRLHKLLGNRWSLIAGRLPGRTDNEIKNYWNTILRKKVEEQKGSLHSSCNQQQNPLKPQETSNQDQLFPTYQPVIQCSNNVVVMNPPPVVDSVYHHMIMGNMKINEMKPSSSSSTTFEKDDSLDRLMDLDINEFLLSEIQNTQPLDHGSHDNQAGGECNLQSKISCGPNFQLSTGEIELDLLIDKAAEQENLNPFDPYFQPSNALDLKSSPSPTSLGLEENWIF